MSTVKPDMITNFILLMMDQATFCCMGLVSMLKFVNALL